jgi:hypothetical protein
MDAIPPIFTSPFKTEWSHLCIRSAELAETSIRSVVASFIVEFEILVVLKGKFAFSLMNLAWKNGRNPTILTSPFKTEWSYLCISSAELAATSIRSVLASFIV